MLYKCCYILLSRFPRGTWGGWFVHVGAMDTRTGDVYSSEHITSIIRSGALFLLGISPEMYGYLYVASFFFSCMGSN